jgi:esterase/lipase superfamily enzyme
MEISEMPQNAEIALAIGNEWEAIAASLGDQRSRIEYELITCLRQLDDPAQNHESVVKAILSLIKPFPDAYAILIKAIASAAPHLTKGTGMPAGYSKKDRYTIVPVFYGTDRAPDSAAGSAHSFGPARGELSYGVAEVSIPDDHRMGEIERPRWWKLQFRATPEKHVILQSIRELPPSEFLGRTRQVLDQGSNREVLLFVHGFNVAFNDAIIRTAQIAYDLHFEGLATLYSWPSEGSVPSYTVDEANVTWSRPRFAQFLTMLRSQLGVTTIHILAHSMGSRLVAETIASLDPAANAGAAHLRQLAFAAPDIDSATFKDLAALFEGKAERVTLYASSDDYALKTSKRIHRYARAGESGLDLVVTEGVDTIDATAVDTSLLGHSYYGDNRSVIADLFDLIRRGSPPNERFGLKPRERFGSRYWLFSP